MSYDNIFSGISGLFWGVTYALIGCWAVVAAVGNSSLIYILLAVTAVYSVAGVFYGSWAARKAVLRYKIH